MDMLVDGCDRSMQLMAHETFSPVVGIMTVASAGEALRLANDSSYGLGSAWPSG